MKNKPKKKFQETKGKLKPNHNWKAPPGYKILVVDRGAVSFNFPADWLLKQMEPIEIHDGDPPNDNARIMVTIWRMPSGIDWTGLPLMPLLVQSTQNLNNKDIKTLSHSEPQMHPRQDIEIAWVEHRFFDKPEQREAFSRIAVVRGWDMHLLITFDYWVDHAEKMIPVWDELMRSLQLGQHIADPLKGPIHH